MGDGCHFLLCWVGWLYVVGFPDILVMMMVPLKNATFGWHHLIIWVPSGKRLHSY